MSSEEIDFRAASELLSELSRPFTLADVASQMITGLQMISPYSVITWIGLIIWRAAVREKAPGNGRQGEDRQVACPRGRGLLGPRLGFAARPTGVEDGGLLVRPSS